MTKTRHAYVLRRRREGKTNYRRRKTLLFSRSVFFTPRISDKNICVQFSKATPKGDIVLASAYSQELYKLGWKGSGKSLPAAYLIGLAAGHKALRAGINDAVLYVGLRRFAGGSRLSAILKGVIDSGVEVPADTEALPTNERIRGAHIVKYAESLSEFNKEIYKKRFSSLEKEGLKPEDYSKHFEQVREKVQSEYGVKK
jgi:large subunit ribosomal protein L18